MAQVSMNAYDADVFINRFKGLVSNGNDPDGDVMYAVEAENVDTTDGFLQPAADPVQFIPSGDVAGWTLDTKFLSQDQLSSSEYNKLLTWYTGATIPPGVQNYHSIFKTLARLDIDVSVSGTVYPAQFFVSTSGNGIVAFGNGDVNVPGLNRVIRIEVNGLVKLNGTVDTTYTEKWYSDTPDVADANWEAVIFQSVKIEDISGNNDFYPNAIYLSSKEKGLYVIQIRSETVGGLLNCQCYKIQTPVNFEHIESFGERLWGCSSTTDKESLYYSATYNPTDWRQNSDHPELGSGQIDQPNWDGDCFTGLRKYGDSLIAFKKHRAWKVTGVDIASMYMTEQFGFGTEFSKTIIASGDRLYMANREGLAVYDGTSVRPLMQENLRGLWSKIRDSAKDKMVALLYENRKYCLAVPVNSDINNTLIVMDTTDGSVLFYKDMYITDFCHPVNAQVPLALWNTGSNTTVKEIQFNAWDKGLATNRATKWVSPWLEFGRKDIQKGGFDLYFTPEVNGENSVKFTISIQTEKKTKTKTYTAVPLTAEEIAAGKKAKSKRLHFGGSGRRFRLTITTEAGKAVKWRLYGGIHIIAEIDKD